MRQVVKRVQYRPKRILIILLSQSNTCAPSARAYAYTTRAAKIKDEDVARAVNLRHVDWRIL